MGWGVMSLNGSGELLLSLCFHEHKTIQLFLFSAETLSKSNMSKAIPWEYRNSTYYVSPLLIHKHFLPEIIAYGVDDEKNSFDDKNTLWSQIQGSMEYLDRSI